MDNTEDINKFLEKHLEPRECILYATKPDPELIEREIVDFQNFTKIFIVILILISISELFMNKSILAGIINFIVAGIFCVIFYLFINYLFYRIFKVCHTEKYYYITNLRVISLEPQASTNDILRTLPISDKLHIYYLKNDKNSVGFQRGFSYYEVIFSNIPDAKYVYEFMKGKING